MLFVYLLQETTTVTTKRRKKILMWKKTSLAQIIKNDLAVMWVTQKAFL